MQDFVKPPSVNLEVQVYENVAKACPRIHLCGQFFVQHTFLLQDPKGFPVAIRRLPASLGDEVVGQVQTALRSQVQPAFDRRL